MDRQHEVDSLKEAIQKKDYDLTKRYLENGVPIYGELWGKSSALRMAIDRQTYDLRIIKLLLDHGADIFEVDAAGNTVLMISAFLCKRDVVELLLKYAELSSCGGTALAAASYVGSYSEVQRLLRKGVEPNDAACSPLLFACMRGDEEMVRILLAMGADPNVEEPRGGTPLIESVKSRNVNIIRQLVNSGADIDKLTGDFCATVSDTNVTALMEACRLGEHGIVEELLLLGADVNIANRDGNTALHLSSISTNYVPLFKTTLAVCLAGRLNRADASSPKIVETLLKFGANVNQRNMAGATPFDVTCKSLTEIFSKQLQSWDRFELQLTPFYLEICEHLLKALAKSRDGSCDRSFSLVLDSFLTSPDMCEIPSVELMPHLVYLALQCGLKPKVDLHVNSKYDHEIKQSVADILQHHQRNCLSLMAQTRICLCEKQNQKWAILFPYPEILKRYLRFEY